MVHEVHSWYYNHIFSLSIAEKFMVDTLQGCPDTFITTVNKYSLSYL